MGLNWLMQSSCSAAVQLSRAVTPKYESKSEEKELLENFNPNNALSIFYLITLLRYILFGYF